MEGEGDGDDGAGEGVDFGSGAGDVGAGAGDGTRNTGLGLGLGLGLEMGIRNGGRLKSRLRSISSAGLLEYVPLGSSRGLSAFGIVSYRRVDLLAPRYDGYIFTRARRAKILTRFACSWGKYGGREFVAALRA